EPAERRALGVRDVSPPVTGGGVPHVVVGGSDVEVAAEHEGLLGIRGVGQPAGEPLEPRELGQIERRADDAAVRRVEAHDAHAAAPMGASARGSSSPTSGALGGRSGSPKLATTSPTPTRLAMATPFQRPSPWWTSS